MAASLSHDACEEMLPGTDVPLSSVCCESCTNQYSSTTTASGSEFCKNYDYFVIGYESCEEAVSRYFATGRSCDDAMGDALLSDVANYYFSSICVIVNLFCNN